MRERRLIDDARRLSPRGEERIAGNGLLPASGAGRRPRVGVEGDLRSTWPGGPNPGLFAVPQGSASDDSRRVSP